MSFFRREALVVLRRWGEPVVVTLALVLALREGWVWTARGSGLGWIALGAAALLALWLRSALAGALTRLRGPGPGVVVLREGEIGYMGPHEGGFLAVAAIDRVEIIRPSRGEPLWLIDAGAEGTLVFPADAEGAERLVEALAALPGFSDMRVARLMQGGGPGRQVVWRRERPAGLPGD